jgi:hypothetical protein
MDVNEVVDAPRPTCCQVATECDAVLWAPKENGGNGAWVAVLYVTNKDGVPVYGRPATACPYCGEALPERPR